MRHGHIRIALTAVAMMLPLLMTPKQTTAG